tara:strand:+ start:199 stop:405 length:207 start_codon:yes stop_codon:yes gene_type:complete
MVIASDDNNVCDSCWDAADEEGMILTSHKDAIAMMRSYGDEIGDHHCENMESTLFNCECGCKRNWKKK